MRKKLISVGLSVVVILVFALPVFAGSTMSWDFELYGNTYAEQTALTIAQAQKSLEEEEERVSYWEQDPLERFKDMLQRQLLYRMTRSIVDAAFGEEGTLQPGHYVVGNYTIDISTDGVVITVVITDTETGDTTTIEVPYYDYEGFSTEGG